LERRDENRGTDSSLKRKAHSVLECVQNIENLAKEFAGLKSKLKLHKLNKNF